MNNGLMAARFLDAPPAIAGLVSLALLAGAHGFEHLAGLEPCALCLGQRAVHWSAVTIAAIMMAIQLWHRPGICSKHNESRTKSNFLFFRALFRMPSRAILIWSTWILICVYLFSVGLSLYHAGIEWRWWSGPAGCSGSDLINTADDLLRGLDGISGGPSCSAAAWRLFGISLAGYNGLISASLIALMGQYAFTLYKQQSHQPQHPMGGHNAR